MTNRFLESNGIYLEFPGVEEPDTPSSGFSQLFLDDDDGLLKQKLDDGSVLQVGARGAWTEEIALTKVATAVASLSLSGWSQDSRYNSLRFRIGLRGDNAGFQTLTFRPNNDSTAGNYYGYNHYSYTTGNGVHNLYNNTLGIFGNIGGWFAHSSMPTLHRDMIDIVFYKYNKTGEDKPFEYVWTGDFGISGSNCWVMWGGGHYIGSSPITSLYLALSVGNIDVDTYYRAWVQ